MRLNLNETVKVKLTERGKELYRQYFTPLPDGYKQPEPRVDEDGFTEIQLWVFMEMFGEHMSMWQPNVIKPLEIVFDNEEEEKQITSKLKNADDSLLTEDLQDCKEKKSKLEVSEEQLSNLKICDYCYKGYCSKYDDGCFHQCVKKPACEDAISREEVLRAIITCGEVDNNLTVLYDVVESLPPVEPEGDKE